VRSVPRPNEQHNQDRRKYPQHLLRDNVTQVSLLLGRASLRAYSLYTSLPHAISAIRTPDAAFGYDGQVVLCHRSSAFCPPSSAFCHPIAGRLDLDRVPQEMLYPKAVEKQDQDIAVNSE
jgi:hypothetical protein